MLPLLQWVDRIARRLDVRFTRCIRQSNGSPVRLTSSLAAALPREGARLGARGVGWCEKALLNILHGIRSGSRFLVSFGLVECGKGFSAPS